MYSRLSLASERVDDSDTCAKDPQNLFKILLNLSAHRLNLPSRYAYSKRRKNVLPTSRKKSIRIAQGGTPPPTHPPTHPLFDKPVRTHIPLGRVLKWYLHVYSAAECSFSSPRPGEFNACRRSAHTVHLSRAWRSRASFQPECEPFTSMDRATDKCCKCSTSVKLGSV